MKLVSPALLNYGHANKSVLNMERGLQLGRTLVLPKSSLHQGTSCCLRGQGLVSAFVALNQLFLPEQINKL